VTATPKRPIGSKATIGNETTGATNGLKRPSTAIGQRSTGESSTPTPGKARPGGGLKAPSQLQSKLSQGIKDQMSNAKATPSKKPVYTNPVGFKRNDLSKKASFIGTGTKTATQS